MENWLLMHTFYHGLNNSTRETMDATAGGAFLSLTIAEVHSYHLLLLKPQLLWRRWHPTKVGVKKELKPAREVEVCTSSNR
jgi:hypothetical protein